MTRRLVILALLALDGCAASAGSQANGHYVGTVTPAGASGPAVLAQLCQGVTRGELDLAGPHFDFAPNEGTIVLHGTIDPSATLSATLSFPGSSHQTYTARFTGHLSGTEITGRLVTPECQAAVALRRE
jgi:hypothetical protein